MSLNMYSQKVHTHTPLRSTCRRIYMASHKEQRERHAQHSHKHGQCQQPHPAPLSGWAGWRSTSGKWVHVHKVDPLAAGLRHSVCPVPAPGSQSSQLLASRHKSPWGHSPFPAADAQSPLQTPTHRQRHRHRKTHRDLQSLQWHAVHQ